MHRRIKEFLLPVALLPLFTAGYTPSFANLSEAEFDGPLVGTACEFYEINMEIVSSRCSNISISVEQLNHRREFFKLNAPEGVEYEIIVEYTPVDDLIYKGDLSRLRSIDTDCANASSCHNVKIKRDVDELSSCTGKILFGETYSALNVGALPIAVSELGRASICRGETATEISFLSKIGKTLDKYTMIRVAK